MNQDYTTIKTVLTKERAIRKFVFADPRRRAAKVSEIDQALAALDRLAGVTDEPATQMGLF